MIGNIERGPATDPTIYGGNMVGEIEVVTLGSFGLGVGNIGVDKRTDIDAELFDVMTQKASKGEYNIIVIGNIPYLCVDGRLQIIGSQNQEMGPSSAGATIGLAYAVDLGGSGLLADRSEKELITTITQRIKDGGGVVGVHDDEHGLSGCGAVAHAFEIYTHIYDNSKNILETANTLGARITREDMQIITRRAKKRSEQEGFFLKNRAEVPQLAESVGANKVTLAGPHQETMVIWNKKESTTINRTQLPYPAFIVDEWSFKKASEMINITGDSEQADLIRKALVVFNIATASVLGDKSLRIVVAENNP